MPAGQFCLERCRPVDLGDCIPADETVQEILARHALHAETLAGLAILLGSCFRRNDECWFFAQSRKQETNPPSFLRRQESTSQTSHRHNNARVRMSTWSAQSCLDSHLQDCARNPRQAVLAVETLAGLAILLGSCFRRNDECWFFAQSRKQETNPPSFLRRRLCKKPSPGCVSCGNPCGFVGFTGFLLSQERRMLVFCTVSKAGNQPAVIPAKAGIHKPNQPSPQ